MAVVVDRRGWRPVRCLDGIVRLRELHDAIDRAVLGAYGWTDIRPTCEFLFDYEIDEVRDRDEVLGRLLTLNAERAVAEQLAGPAVSKTVRTRKRATAVNPLLLDESA